MKQNNWRSKRRVKAGIILGGIVLALLPAVTIKAQSGGRYFYLTNNNYSSNEVLTACDAGYHMASLWEILDVTNLIYDYKNPAAKIKADSGYGPPSNWYGWIRTGEESSGANTAGTGNCLNWTSSLNTNYGTIVRLSNAWETTPGDIFTWDAAIWNCGGIAPVWCVGDFKAFYWPMFIPAIQNKNQQ
jgi:hypothetical protein